MGKRKGIVKFLLCPMLRPEKSLSQHSPAKNRTACSKKRSGMTLIELILVMAIMVVVAALAGPAIQRTFSLQALQKGADRVRVAMGQARVRAIKNGEEYAVFFNPDGAWFDVAPFANFQEQAGRSALREKLADAREQTNYEEDLLPKGVRFASAVTSSDARSMEVISENGGGSEASMQSVLFYPDGTSQDARILVRNEKGNFVEIQLRGLTGIARTVRVEGVPSVR
ncbi:MAG: Tfp pilus assembly protein FimT/FimU [Mariniblastus sp.]